MAHPHTAVPATPHRATLAFLEHCQEVAVQHGITLHDLSTELFDTPSSAVELESLQAARTHPTMDELDRLYEALDQYTVEAPFKEATLAQRAEEGLRSLGLSRGNLKADALSYLLVYARSLKRQAELRAEEPRHIGDGLPLVVGCIERGIGFEDCEAHEALFHELDRLRAENTALRRSHLRVVS